MRLVWIPSGAQKVDKTLSLERSKVETAHVKVHLGDAVTFVVVRGDVAVANISRGVNFLFDAKKDLWGEESVLLHYFMLTAQRVIKRIRLLRHLPRRDTTVDI